MTMVWEVSHAFAAFAGEQSKTITISGKGGNQVLLHEVNFNTLRQGATCEVWKVAGTTSVNIARFNDPYTQFPQVQPVPYDVTADAFHIASEVDVTVLFR